MVNAVSPFEFFKLMSTLLSINAFTISVFPFEAAQKRKNQIFYIFINELSMLEVPFIKDVHPFLYIKFKLVASCSIKCFAISEKL